MLRCVNFNDLHAPGDDSDVAKRLQQMTYHYAGTASLPKERRKVRNAVGHGPQIRASISREGSTGENSAVSDCNLRAQLVVEGDVWNYAKFIWAGPALGANDCQIEV